VIQDGQVVLFTFRVPTGRAVACGQLLFCGLPPNLTPTG